MHHALAATLALCAALALAACGGGGDSSSEDPAAVDGSMGTAPATEPADGASGNGAAVLTGTQPLLNGEPTDLSQYRGKVVLAVNTASECGFTPQFEGLESLYEERRADGLVVLGFPADDVANQEPRDDAEIAEFCEANFGVSFPMFSKSNVVDEPVNPLFASLADQLGAPTFNFNKYLIDRKGRPVARFDTSVEPMDPELTDAIDQQL